MRAAEKRLAVAVPDHSLGYIDYEGTIDEGKYGAGDVRIWDDGKYETAADPAKQLENGKLVVTFFGLQLRGEFVLVRIYGRDDQWLLIKAHDHYADPEWQLATVLPTKKERRETHALNKRTRFRPIATFLNRLWFPLQGG
jgi:bifunctional non-homologous end joining protein LigD